MPRYTYERLSAQDTFFLLMERPSLHMHIAAVQIYETGPLRAPNGGVDIQAIRRAIESVLHLIPRYRQRLKWIPLDNHPVWVDDRRFNLEYHVRHTALPRPGTDDQLRTLAARLMEHQLDRRKPLWEMWVIEGLEGDRFAVVSKIHHCMIDGMSGVDLAQIVMSPSPDPALPDPTPYIPRPAPSASELFYDEWKRRLALPLRAADGLRDLGQGASALRKEIGKRAEALGSLLGYAVRSASDTPLNGPLGPHRRIEWLAMPLDEIKAVRRAFGCTVNDVVLATVAGAVRNYLIYRRVDPALIDFRVAAPVSVRSEAERGKLGNRISSWIVPLPISTPTASGRLTAIIDQTRHLKASEHALGVTMLMGVAEWAPGVLLSLGSRAVSGPINMIVTNVPGPPFPLYMVGARLLAMFPVAPLLGQTGAGIALFSYDGNLFWGLKADPDLVPDLPELVRSIERSFAELKNEAKVASTESLPERTPVSQLRSAAAGMAPVARARTRRPKS